MSFDVGCSKDRVRMTEATVHSHSVREELWSGELTRAARALRRHVLPVAGALTGVHEDCDSIQVFLRVHFILPIL